MRCDAVRSTHRAAGRPEGRSRCIRLRATRGMPPAAAPLRECDGLVGLRSNIGCAPTRCAVGATPSIVNHRGAWRRGVSQRPAMSRNVKCCGAWRRGVSQRPAMDHNIKRCGAWRRGVSHTPTMKRIANRHGVAAIQQRPTMACDGDLSDVAAAVTRERRHLTGLHRRPRCLQRRGAGCR
jgi:hypothetical protein